MWYKPNVNSSSFQDITFQPIFTPKFTPTEEEHVQNLCGNDANCRLDYAAKRNDALAIATASISVTNHETSSFVCEFVVNNIIKH